MKHLVLCLLALGAIRAAVAGGWVIVNEDNDGFFVHRRPNISTRDLDERVEELLSGGRVTHVFWCVNGCRPNYDSKVWEPIWTALEDPQANYSDTPRLWPENVKALFDQGIDPARHWIARTRQKSASPWVSMRMNDNHYIWIPHAARVCRFNQEHPEWWVVPHYTGGQWEPYALDFARKEVRDHTFALVDEIVRRYDADGIELDFCRAATYFNERDAIANTPVMTAFIARCRDAAKAEAARRKRPYSVAIRLAHDRETARRRGFDAVEIARQGLVDVIIVCADAADMGWDRSFEDWKRALGEAAPQVRLVAGTTAGFSLSRRLHNPASLRAWAELQRDAGAEDLYIFNHQYMTKEARSAVCDGTAFAATDAVGPREFAVSTTIPQRGDMPRRWVFPVALSANPSLSVHLPKNAVARKSVEVRFGHRETAPFAGEVRLNGVASTGGGEAEEKGVRLVRRTFPLAALTGGENRISFAGAGTDAVTWASLVVDARCELADVRDRLRAHVVRLAAQTKVPFGTNGTLSVLQPAAPGGYRGLWPDDWYFPNKVAPEILTKDDAQKLFRFLTESVEGAKVLPDRVEPSGHLVFQPGAEGHPHGRRMPAHLPAAWIRLVKYLRERTGDAALTERWRGVIARSVAALEVRDGLVWLSDAEPQVGFGFFDTVGLSGGDLMSNVVLERGLRQGEALFGGELGTTCRKLADGIRANLRRLRTDEGWYLSDSAGCRQFSPWSNGLLYGAPYLGAADRTAVGAKIVAVRPDVTCRGQVRHCPEPWRKMNAWAGGPRGAYMDGGYWAVGTAYSFAALYAADPDAAVVMLKEMLAALEKSDFAEWESRDGRQFGARKFMMSAALPLAAIEAVLADRPLLDWF